MPELEPSDCRAVTGNMPSALTDLRIRMRGA
jgi:hypothetical protein